MIKTTATNMPKDIDGQDREYPLLLTVMGDVVMADNESDGTVIHAGGSSGRALAEFIDESGGYMNKYPLFKGTLTLKN
jgi:hypothetical protein